MAQGGRLVPDDVLRKWGEYRERRLRDRDQPGLWKIARELAEMSSGLYKPYFVWLYVDPKAREKHNETSRRYKHTHRCAINREARRRRKARKEALRSLFSTTSLPKYLDRIYATVGERELAVDYVTQKLRRQLGEPFDFETVLVALTNYETVRRNLASRGRGAHMPLLEEIRPGVWRYVPVSDASRDRPMLVGGLGAAFILKVQELAIRVKAALVARRRCA